MHFQGFSLKQAANLNWRLTATLQMIHAYQTYHSLSSCLVTRWHESAVEFMLKVRSLCKNKTRFITTIFLATESSRRGVSVCAQCKHITFSKLWAKISWELQAISNFIIKLSSWGNLTKLVKKCPEAKIKP